MGASKEDEDDAYRRFAETCGNAWKASKIKIPIDAAGGAEQVLPIGKSVSAKQRRPGRSAKPKT